MPPTHRTPDELWTRLSAKFEEEPERHCWIWAGARESKMPYGVTTIRYQRKLVHRVIYELLIGPIPDGLTIDHLCRDPRCVNPGHLEPVTLVENVMRGNAIPAVNARKTHCKYGHPFSGDNLHIKPDGERVCIVCRRSRSRVDQARRRARLKEAA